MNYRFTSFIAALLLLSISTIYSQSEKLDILKKYKAKYSSSNIEQNYSGSSLEIKTPGESQFPVLKINTTETAVESVFFKMVDGNKYRESYIYNSAGEVASYVTELWDGTQWGNYRKFSIYYDNEERMTGQLAEAWDGTQWENFSRSTHQYDAEGNMTNYSTENWEEGQWVIDYTQTSEFDADGNEVHVIASLMGLDLVLDTEYDSDGRILWESQLFSTSGVTLDYWRTTYTYFPNGNVQESLNETNQEGQWVAKNKSAYTYDDHNNKILTLREYWDADNSTWFIGTRFTYEFDANNNNTLTLYEGWNETDAAWEPSRRIIENYDVNNNQLLYLWQNCEDGQFINYSKYYYLYNSEGHLIYGEYVKWENETWMPYNGYHEFDDQRENGTSFNFNAWQIEDVTYATITDVEDDFEIAKGYSLLQNYPNPFNPATTISYTIPESGLVSLKVYDILGKEVASLVNAVQAGGTHNVNFNAANLTSGIYFYKIEAGSFTSTKKLLLLK